MVDVDVCEQVPLPNATTTLETHVFVDLSIPNVSVFFVCVPFSGLLFTEFTLTQVLVQAQAD